MSYEIIDDYLPTIIHQQIEDIMVNSTFPWNFINQINSSDEKSNELNNYYFIHHFYSFESKSQYLSLIMPLINKIQPKALMRIKGNLYTRTENLVHHAPHVDYKFKHNGAIYYVNSNDGYTILHDGTKVESVKNRLLLFNPSRSHHSTNCTNAKVRCNINFNYF